MDSDHIVGDSDDDVAQPRGPHMGGRDDIVGDSGDEAHIGSADDIIGGSSDEDMGSIVCDDDDAGLANMSDTGTGDSDSEDDVLIGDPLLLAKLRKLDSIFGLGTFELLSTQDINHYMKQEEQDAASVIVEQVFPSGTVERSKIENILKHSFPSSALYGLVQFVLVLIATTLRNRAKIAADMLFDVIEFNAGVCALTQACIAVGLVCKAFDISLSVGHDSLTPNGFKQWVSTLLVAKEGALAWLAPECKSWTWVSRHSAGRSKGNLWGNDSVKMTRRANETTFRQDGSPMGCGEFRTHPHKHSHANTHA